MEGDRGRTVVGGRGRYRAAGRRGGGGGSGYGGPASAVSPCAATVKACARLSTHQVWLTDGNGTTTLGPMGMNDGAPDTATPSGMFTVQWKDKDHRSSEFNDAPMPYSVFFDTHGRAFHAGDPSRQSAGCIRLPTDAAKVFFDALQPGDQVQILP